MQGGWDTGYSSSSSGVLECSERRRLPAQAHGQQQRESTPDIELPDTLKKTSPQLAKLLLGVQPPRRTRRKVEADEYDEKGNRRSPAELRRVKRRITNRESAKYMREMRLQDMDAVRKEVMALLNRTAELQDLLLKAHELQAELQQHSSSWQQLWSAAAASNIKLSGRLAAHERMVASVAANSKTGQSGPPALMSMPIMAGQVSNPSTAPASFRMGTLKEESILAYELDMHAPNHEMSPKWVHSPDMNIPLGLVPGPALPRQYSMTPPLLSAAIDGPLNAPPAISPIVSGLSQARASLDSVGTDMILHGMQCAYMPLV